MNIDAIMYSNVPQVCFPYPGMVEMNVVVHLKNVPDQSFVPAVLPPNSVLWNNGDSLLVLWKENYYGPGTPGRYCLA